MMVYCYIAIVYGKTHGNMYRRYIVHFHIFSIFALGLQFVTAHGLALILFLCYVVILITGRI